MLKFLLPILILTSCFCFSQSIVSFEVKDSMEVKFHLNDSTGKPISSLEKLKNSFKGGNLLFAMNGGMYQKDRSPLGLFIEDEVVLKKLNRVKNAYGNFYMQPNGVFYVDSSGRGNVIKTEDFKLDSSITYATQSGPMLLIEGNYHPKFRDGSKNLNIRNGVGILPNGNMIFAISTEPVNLYDFASFFKVKGCKQALYLDGFVSKAYCPSLGIYQKGGQFGPMISVSK